MGEISVDLQTRVIPENHNVYVARPGQGARLYGTFLDQSAIGPDFPGLDLRRGVPLADQQELERRVRRSIRLRNWHLSGRLKDNEPDRDLKKYSPADFKGMGQYRSILLGYFERAARGDLAIITPKSWSLPALIVEFRDDPMGIVEIPADFYPRDPLSGRRVRILAKIEKRKLPAKVLDIVEKPNAFVILEKSARPVVYRLAYWEHLNWDSHTLHIPVTKNGHARTIPLTTEALNILRELQTGPNQSERVFPLTIEAVKLAWVRLTKRAGIEDLHFHDLRHEAVSRFFERGLSVPEVALISGHKDPRMLFRYTHLKAEDVARKLNAATA